MEGSKKLQKRNYKLGSALLCALLLVVGCKQGATSVAEPSTQIDAKANHVKAVETFIEEMPLEAKVGQMLFVGIPGTTYDATAQKMVEELNVGGIIHFDRNLSTKRQVQTLNANLQAGADRSARRVPLFIAVDQEGGQVARMRGSLLVQPSAASLGEKGDPSAVKSWALKTAQSLKEFGFNTNFAPVADLGLTNRRSYGRTAETVTPMVEAALDGYQAAKVLCSVKHFPGIGKMTVDPHVDSSAINATQGELEANDMAPFLAMVNKKEHHSFMVMVSHLIYPSFDKEPASVSQVFLTDVLRKQWRYEGVIITDDMAMGGLSKVYSNEEMGIKAVQAGADILLSCSSDPAMSYTIYRKVLAAVKEGTIAQKRINESVKRILLTKEKLGLWQLPPK